MKQNPSKPSSPHAGGDACASTPAPAWLHAILAAFLLVLPTTALYADKAVVPILLAAALASGVGVFVQSRRLPRLDGLSAAVLALLLAWAALTASWSPDPAHGSTLVLRLAPLVALGWTFCAAMTSLPIAARERLYFWLLAGLGLAFAALLGELASDFAGLRLTRDADLSRYHLLSNFNRGLTLIALLVWPAALVAGRLWGPAAAMALPVAAFTVIVSYESGAAKVALVAGAAAAAVAWAHARLGLAAIIVGLALAFVAAPLGFAFLPRDVVFALDHPVVPGTVDTRLDIWRFVAERAMEKPLAGWGLDAARFMSGTGDWAGTSPISLHPHNNPLELWMELGAVGALTAFAWLVWLSVRAGRGGRGIRACRLGFIAAGLAISCTAYGMWQSQWISSLLAAVAVLLMVCGPARTRC